MNQLKRLRSAEKAKAAADARRLRAVARSQRRLKPGPDFLARSRRELDRAFRREMPDAAEYFAAAEEAFRRGLRGHRAALNVLATAPPVLQLGQ
ncbi:hypothetical protein GA0070624_3656 [Micromonospora rhizosphaerae]|uniref:Uncharacterized protein n=1 Tax=Micromonospora rhizosphaerae TaxID=568872 RepID=A0A1C6SFK1_9ACTN|nr:hypothetical protein [Micromonospora rhizosphaerae]SCL28254.1 hypothetical protein GA0070624_3656 [Micromonospora rhizosphaerae]